MKAHRVKSLRSGKLGKGRELHNFHLSHDGPRFKTNIMREKSSHDFSFRQVTALTFFTGYREGEGIFDSIFICALLLSLGSLSLTSLKKNGGEIESDKMSAYGNKTTKTNTIQRS